MTFISVTRLRIRKLRFLASFVPHAFRANRQAARATGFRRGALLADRAWTFWTLTAWDSEADMRAYITAGSHRQSMPRLMDWCDEASVVHWEQPAAALPDWTEADRRMRADGRPSKIRYPSPDHAALSYRPPRLRFSGTLEPRPNN